MISTRRAALRAAFPHTLPVMAGYLFLGAAFGVMLEGKGYGPAWAAGMSLVVYAGAMQFVGVGLMVAAFNPLYVFLLTLLVNARHLFYGVSLLERYRGLGWKKPFLVFWLTDETFSIICSTRPPLGVDRGWFKFFISMLNHCYWIAGATIGNVMGMLFAFDSRGIDFVMTALFVVIFINQWKAAQSRKPALIGLAAAALCLICFGRDYFILPSMALIVVCLTLARGRIEAESPDTRHRSRRGRAEK